jgi:Flp pilus assembly pilin Flp
VNAVTLMFLGRAEGAVAAAKETDAAVKGVGVTAKETSAVGSGAFKSLGSTIKMVAGTFLLAGGLVEGVKSAIDQSEELSKATDSLRTALQHNGEDADKLVPRYQALAKSAAQYGISEADAMSGLAKATVLTGSAQKAMHAYEEAVVISKAAHVPFTSALTATSKAQNGVTTSLARYGIQVSKDMPGTEQYRVIMKRFGGQAEANTTSLDKLKANAQNLGAQLGGPLLNGLELVAGALSSVVGWIQQNKAILEPLVVVIGAAAAAWGLWTLAVEANTLVTKANAAAQALLNAVMDLNPIMLVVIALAALAAAFYEAWKNSQTFRDIVNGVWADIKGKVTGFVSFFTVTLPATFQTVLDWVKGHWPELATLLSGPFAPIVLLATGAFGIREKIVDGLGDVLAWLRDKWQDVEGLAKGVWNRVVGVADGAFGLKGKILDGLGDVRSWLSNTWDTVKGLITSPFSSLADAASNGFGIPDKITKAFSGVKSWLTSTFSSIGGALSNVLRAPVNMVIGLLDSLDFGVHYGGLKVLGHTVIPSVNFDWHPFHIPQLAAGGLVTRSTAAILGEAGSEAVIPLTSPHAFGFADMLADRIASAGGGQSSGATYFPNARIQVLGTTDRQVAAALKQIVDGASARPGYATPI